MSGEDKSTNNNTDMMTAILEAINNSKNEFHEKFESLKNDNNNNNKDINDKFEIIQDKFVFMKAENAVYREGLLARIDSRSRLSSRVCSRATSSKQLALGHAVILTATIPVAPVPIIITALKTPPLCFAVSDNETSPTRMEPILSVTNITALDSQQLLETMIEVPVRTSTSPYDITPSSKSGHASEVVPTVDSPSMDADDYNHKESVIYNNFNDQHANSAHQPEQPCFIFNSDNSNCTFTQVPIDNSPRIDIDVSHESAQDDPNNFNNERTNSTLQLVHACPIIIEDNFINNKYGCFSGDCDATSYSDWGTVHVPMTMVLVS